MTANATKRLLKELAQIKNTRNEDFVYLHPRSDSDLLYWTAELIGPPQTAYSGAKWRIEIIVPDTYPIYPPSIRFVTPICHPNIDFNSGDVCLDVLKTDWSPAWTLASTLKAVRVLLQTPGLDSPLNVDAANILRAGDELGFASLVTMYKQQYAIIDETIDRK